MKISRSLSLLFPALFISFISVAQDDSCRLHISLLTCSTGEELYSSFGHTAIRVTDSARGNDIVFNYGTFDDSDPNFYLKFTQGIMIYALSAYPFADFMQEYQVQGRGVIEQTLLLSCASKRALFSALLQNAQEQHRFYNYYFKEDNCTTRAKEMVVKHTVEPITFKNILPAKTPTYRELIHNYLNLERQYWSKFGIDILLGSNLDKKVTNEQAMFLPDYLMQGFDSALVNNQPLVSNKQIILPVTRKQHTPSLLTPPTFFWLLLFIIAAASFSKINRVKTILGIFDRVFFGSIGLLGVLLVVLWLVRVDTVCRNNFNLLWALPTHLPVVFLLGGKRSYVKKYFRVTIIISLLSGISLFFIPQEMNMAITPLLVLIIVRSYFRSR